MPKKSVRKRLTTRKNCPTYGRKKRDKENALPKIPNTALLNTTSCCLSSASSKQENGETGACPSQVLVETVDTCSSPPATPPAFSPVTPNAFHELSDCLISPSTGVLRSRNNYSFCGDAFEEGTLVNSTPLKGVQGGTRAEQSSLSFSDDAFEEHWRESFPPLAAAKGDFPECEPTKNKSGDQVFTVSSMSVIDGTPSGIYPRPLTEKVQVPNIGTPPSSANCPFHAVKDLLDSLLPTSCEVAANSTKTAFSLRMMASADCWNVIQRSALISKDGTVQLSVHGQVMGLDHPIWQDLPCRVCLTNLESVGEFSQYVVDVFHVFRSYVVCMGIPESQYFNLAAKHPDLVFDRNILKETRYTETYRSRSCEILLSTKVQMKKFCSSCYAIRRSILRRFKTIDPVQSPHVNVNNRWLDSTQKRRKLSKLSRQIKNSRKREKYFRVKAAALIEKYGVDIDERTSRDFKDCLDQHYKSLKNSDKEEDKLQRIFIEQQLKASKVKGPSGMRWHPVMIRLALQIYMVSPAAYDCIAGTGIIRLPSSKTLFDYSHFTVAKQGINYCAVQSVVDQVAEHDVDHHKRYFLLLMDEMSISQNLVYSRATGELSGFVHLSEVQREVAGLEREMDTYVSSNTNDSDEILRRRRIEEVADFGNVIPDVSQKVLCYMAVGLTNGVKQVVASYGTNHLQAFTLGSYTWDVVRFLEGCQIHVLGLVCDGHSTNRKFIKMHKPLTNLKSGTVFDTANMAYPPRPFYFFSDVPHLLKTLRNNFYNSGAGKKSRLLKNDGQFIEWQTIVQLYEKEKNNELRLAHKLNAQVVYLNSYSQMKVSYAARVFSRTVANAINVIFPNGEKKVTADFITKVNDFFDCLNGAGVMHGARKRNALLNPYRLEYEKDQNGDFVRNSKGERVIKEDVRFAKLMAFKNYLKKWQATGLAKSCISHETIEGVEMTVHSFISCVKFMWSKGAPFILARVFCQDPLEQHFGKHRGTCGGSRNPNMTTFLRNENKFLNLKCMGFNRHRGNTKVVRDADYADKICAPLLKRQRPNARKERVLRVRRALMMASSSYKG